MRAKTMNLSLCVVFLLAALPTAFRQEAGQSLGELTLSWTATCQVSEDYSSSGASSNVYGPVPHEVRESLSLTLTYEGHWCWQVLEVYGDNSTRLDEGRGQWSVGGGGGGTHFEQEYGAVDCYSNGRRWKGPYRNTDTASWSYQVAKGAEGRVPWTELYLGDGKAGFHVGLDRADVLHDAWEVACTATETTVGQYCGSTSASAPPYPYCGSTEAALTSALVEAFIDNEDRLQEPFNGSVPCDSKGFTVSRDYACPYQETDDQLGPDARRTSSGQVQVHFTLSYCPKPSNLEAVITFPEGADAYAAWLPQAGADESRAGNRLQVEVQLRRKDQPEEPVEEKATFRFRLVDATHEPGVCLNAPPKGKARFSPDLGFEQLANPDLDIADEGQTAQTITPAREAVATVSSYDWGAYARLEVVATTEGGQVLYAHLDGRPEVQLVTIPRDDNGNRIADAWEESEGVLGRNLPADWAGAERPQGQKSAGDGIGLYEKYRGFRFAGRHERLHAGWKYVFIHDPDLIVWMTMSDPRSAAVAFPAVSQCRVRFVGDQQWTGPGKAGDGKRIVNFNTSGWGHAVDQHALDVVEDSANSPVAPTDWRRLWAVSAGHPYTQSLEGILGMTWPDYTSAGVLASPAGTYRISIFSAKIDESTTDHVRYNSWALPAFSGAARDWSSLTVAQQQQVWADMQSEVDNYIRAHPSQYEERRLKRTADVTAHELGHGVGISHHRPTSAGSRTCTMRYFEYADCPANANDRFELGCRTPWPGQFCTSGAETAGGKGCWAQVQVSDKLDASGT